VQPPRDQAWRYASDNRSVSYWYRESPEVIVANAFFRPGAQVSSPGFISETQPAPAVPVEAVLEFGADGRLQSLLVVPPRYSNDAAKPVNWTPLLEAARLDRASLTPVAPAASIVPFDQRAAWRSGASIIEAAAFGGRVVSFDVRDAKNPAAPRYPSRSVLIVWMSMLISVIWFLARRNIRQGRADVRGATRVALFATGISVLTFAFGADHVPTQSEGLLVLMCLAWAALTSIAIFGGYIALEPTMRRRWPQSLVSWTRLLNGQFRDPIVGRDVLAGCVGGLILVLGEVGLRLVLAAIHGTPPVPIAESNVAILNGGTLVLSEIISGWGRAILDSMAFVIFLVLFRRLVRKRWAAALILFGVLALQHMNARDTVSMLFSTAILVLCAAYLPARFGFLSLVVAFGVEATMSVTPVLWPPATWHTGITAAGVAVVMALAVYGFVVSLGGRSLFTADFAEA